MVFLMAIISLMLTAFHDDKDTQHNQNKRQYVLRILVKIKAIELNDQKDDANRRYKPAFDSCNPVYQRTDTNDNQQNWPGLTKAVTGALADKD